MNTTEHNWVEKVTDENGDVWVRKEEAEDWAEFYQRRNSAWYEFDVDNESLDQCRDRRLRQCPTLSPAEMEVLRQCRTAIWDGNVVSKSARSSLVSKGLVTRFNGWQVITQEGLAVLDTLGELKP